MSKIKITLEMDCNSISEFEDNLGMDEHFDLVDSIIWLLDYGTKEDLETGVARHNNIKLSANDEMFAMPYRGDKR